MEYKNIKKATDDGLRKILVSSKHKFPQNLVAIFYGPEFFGSATWTELLPGAWAGRRWRSDSSERQFTPVSGGQCWLLVGSPRPSPCDLLWAPSQDGGWIPWEKPGWAPPPPWSVSAPALPCSLHGDSHNASPSIQGRGQRLYLLIQGWQGSEERVRLPIQLWPFLEPHSALVIWPGWYLWELQKGSALCSLLSAHLIPRRDESSFVKMFREIKPNASADGGGEEVQQRWFLVKNLKYSKEWDVKYDGGKGKKSKPVCCYFSMMLRCCLIIWRPKRSWKVSLVILKVTPSILHRMLF